MIRRLGFGAAVAAAAAIQLAAQTTDSTITSDTYKALKFRYVGPVGNRIIAIAGVPGSPYIYYAGAASGGIFKTTDNGAHWDAFSVPGPQAYPGCNFAVSAYTCQDTESSKDNTVADSYLYVDPATSKIFCP